MQCKNHARLPVAESGLGAAEAVVRNDMPMRHMLVGASSSAL